MVIVVCHVKFRRCREIKPAMTLQDGTPCIAKLAYNLLNVWVYGGYKYSEWGVFFINYVDGELDEGMIGVDQQETNRRGIFVAIPGSPG